MKLKANNKAQQRAEQAIAALKCCRLCPRNCAVDRTARQTGYCRLGDAVYCFREMLYWGEEQQLSPSHQIYLAGCNLTCQFCTVSEWNEQPQAGTGIDLGKLPPIITERVQQGARTINFLGGEPAVNVHGILHLLAGFEPPVPVVWNSNMYYNDIVGELVAGLIDIYLADLKCGNAGCAQSLLGASDYLQVARRNILRAARHGHVIVRHLLLPGHFECCAKPILNWIAAELPDVELSLRRDYVPPAVACAAPKEYLRESEFEKAVNLAEDLGIRLVQ